MSTFKSYIYEALVLYEEKLIPKKYENFLKTLNLSSHAYLLFNTP